jgi:DNA replication protein DnaC
MSDERLEYLAEDFPQIQDLRMRKPTVSGECVLGLCDGSGFLIDEETNTATDCGCRQGRIARRRTARLEGRLPRRYEGVSFDRPPIPEIERRASDQVGEVRRHVRQISKRLDSGKGLWIQGDIGTGKTTLAMLVSKAALEADRSVAIYSLPRLLNLLRESMESSGGKLDLIDRLTDVDLLHIDDLGAENTTEWVLEQLYSIVNARYEAERAIVATTNLMPDALSERLGARTVSRLVEICGDPITLTGDDDRRLYPFDRSKFSLTPEDAPGLYLPEHGSPGDPA